MEQEVWKNVIGYEGLYMVSNLGRVKALERKVSIANKRSPYKTQRLKEHLKKQQKPYGYLRTNVCKNGIVHNFQVHRLVALSFIPNPEKKSQVNHINGIKTDNRVVNLEWATQSENMKHAFKIGLQELKGEKHPMHKVTEKIVREIRAKFIPKVCTVNMLAEEYKLSMYCVRDIVYNQRWKHVV